MISRGRRLIIVLVASALPASQALAVDYAASRLKAVKACEAIDPSLSQSGLVFNPDGYRSFYLRSQCFQEAAVQFRDATLCANVKERRSLLSSSWGYTAARCRQLVSEGTTADRRALDGLKSMYAAGGMRFRDFRIERNGNGRDFDIIPMFDGTYAHGYTLTFEIVQPASAAPLLLHRMGYYVDERSNLRIYVTQAAIRKTFSEFALDRSYAVRATISLDVDSGSQSGYWSPAFIEGVFPARERSQSITKPVRF